jgi:hypothetical protein
VVYSIYIPCIFHVYSSHLIVLARFVAHARLAASDRNFLWIFSVLATERLPTRGWGRPKFHSQVLIS